MIKRRKGLRMQVKLTKEAANRILGSVLERVKIRLNEELNLEKIASVDEGRQLRQIEGGMYEVNGETYKFSHKKGRNFYEYGLIIKKAAFIIEPIAEVVEVERSKDKNSYYKDKFRIKAPNNEVKEFTVTLTEINKTDKFDEILNKLGTYLHSFTDKELKEYLLKTIEERTLPKIYVTKTTGYNNINGNSFWITGNKITKYSDSIQELNSVVELSKDATLRPEICDLNIIESDENFKQYLNNASNYFSCLIPITTEQKVLLSLLYYTNMQKIIEKIIVKIKG